MDPPRKGTGEDRVNVCSLANAEERATAQLRQKRSNAAPAARRAPMHSHDSSHQCISSTQPHALAHAPAHRQPP
eukprot:15110154-Alexandrium_andersonii.AAC.1